MGLDDENTTRRKKMEAAQRPIDTLAEPTSAIVSVAPQDRQTVETMLPDIIQQIANCTHIELQDDQSITQGGCIIKTKQGSIDATIERQIQRIVEALCPGDVNENPDEELMVNDCT